MGRSRTLASWAGLPPSVRFWPSGLRAASGVSTMADAQPAVTPHKRPPQPPWPRQARTGNIRGLFAQAETADSAPTRMIIQSLLDTDLYKFTMMQVVLHHFTGAQVDYRSKCRTEGVDLTPYVEEIRDEVMALSRLRFREDELDYLRSLRFMKSDFVDFLALFQFNDKYVRIGHGERPGEMDITIRGPWLHTIMYEIPVLALVSEIYFRRTQPRPDLQEGRRRLKAKIELVRTVERELDFRISDFGTRRRFSCAWHEEVPQALKREVPEYFAGTSNVWFAMRNNMTPLGTMAHEYMQPCHALRPRLRD